mmetsp:Transcript_24604/g.68889  ORF Transcript_24604/g.68889 Transcript_24604/m.68889 type:complete len:214 (+) Transcript_24604:617-1258(+)
MLALHVLLSDPHNGLGHDPRGDGALQADEAVLHELIGGLHHAEEAGAVVRVVQVGGSEALVQHVPHPLGVVVPQALLGVAPRARQAERLLQLGVQAALLALAVGQQDLEHAAGLCVAAVEGAVERERRADPLGRPAAPEKRLGRLAALCVVVVLLSGVAPLLVPGCLAAAAEQPRLGVATVAEQAQQREARVRGARGVALSVLGGDGRAGLPE